MLSLQELKCTYHIKKKSKKHDKIVLLAKGRLKYITFLISTNVDQFVY